MRIVWQPANVPQMEKRAVIEPGKTPAESGGGVCQVVVQSEALAANEVPAGFEKLAKGVDTTKASK